MKPLQILILGCALLFAKPVKAQIPLQKNIEQNSVPITAFPPAKANQKQIVIYLPPKESFKAERNYKVEILPGKTMTVDCNMHGLDGTVQSHILEGFGIDYYTFTTNGNVSSTRMGCPESSNHEEFVTAKPVMIDYNSQMPIVIYVPTGYDVKYRIWTAGPVTEPAETAETTTASADDAFYQTWEWASSEGGYAGKKTSLKNSGLHKTYTFKKDGTYLYYKNGKMVPGGKFKLSNGVSIFVKGKLPMIELAGSDRKMSYSLKDKNTLVLSEECYDCYRHTYIRKTKK